MSGGCLNAGFPTHEELLEYLREEGPFSQYQVAYIDGDEMEPPMWKLHIPAVQIIKEESLGFNQEGELQ